MKISYDNPIVKYRTNRQTKKFDCSYFGNPLEEEEDDIEENDIEEDDFEKDTNFRSGRHQSHSVSNVKNRINNFVKQIDEILY